MGLYMQHQKSTPKQIILYKGKYTENTPMTSQLYTELIIKLQ